MLKFFKDRFAFLFLCVCILFTCAAFAAPDSLGVAGVEIGKLFKRIGVSESQAVGLVTVLGAVAFRLFQIILQRLPTRWKWVNNRLTLGLINRILSWAFGKTTMVYNAHVVSNMRSNEIAKEQLKKTAMKHLSRAGGILKEFNKALSAPPG